MAPRSAPAADQVETANVTSSNAYWTQVTTASSPSIQAAGMSVGSDGSVLLTGWFTGQAIFPTGVNSDDSIVLLSSGQIDIFAARFDPNSGYFTWAQRAGGTASDQAFAIAVHGDDTAVLTGSFAGVATFPTGSNADDSIVLSATGGGDIFVAAINPDTGYFMWAQRAGGRASEPGDRDVGRAIASRGNALIVTGEYQDQATFPTGPSTEIILSGAVSSQGFIASINPDTGYFIWAQRLGGDGTSIGQAVAINSRGQPVIAGSFSRTATFPRSATADDSFALTGTSRDIFVAAMNADDSYFTWVQGAGGAGFDEARALVLTSDDTPIITGRFVNAATFPSGSNVDDSITLIGSGIDAFVAGLNSDDSYFAWAQRATATQSTYGNSVALTSSGSVVVSGHFGGTVSFPTGVNADDSITFTTSGLIDAYVAGFDPTTGYFTWVQRADGAGSSDSRAVAILGDDSPIVAGHFNQTVTLPNGLSTNFSITAKPAVSNINVFIGLIGPVVPNPNPDPPAPAPVFPPSTPIEVRGEPGDASATVRWSAPGSSGSFPVTTYEVRLSPGGASCLVAARTTQCTISDLVNGVAYTASVRALNGAGWGPFSAASDPFTPFAPAVESIVITGSRGEVRGRPGVIVRGVTTGMVGQVVTARVRLAGQTSYATGASRTIGDDERFTWQRRTGKTVSVVFDGDAVRSNRVVIRPR